MPQNRTIFVVLIWICCIAFVHAHALNIAKTKQYDEMERKTHIIRSENMQATNVSTFFNVIVQNGADPWMYKHTDGWYYLTFTTGGDVRIWRSRSLTSIFAGDSIVAWRPSGSGPACRDVWAPELHFIHSSWYVYFTATTCDGNIGNHRMFVLENTNPDPFNGSYTFKGQINDVTNKWAIDGTVFEHPSGQLYMIWSGWEGDVASPQLLYLAAMSNPWTIISERILISRPTYDWEKSGGAEINEGPEVTIRNDFILLVYSAAACWTDNYCLGLITVPINQDPMNPSAWEKHPQPIFKSANNVFGPGHHSFTKSRDDKEDWIVYHSARFEGAGEVRQVRAQKFTWNADSTPNLGEPVNRDIAIQIPSGDQVRVRYEAEAARLLNNPRAIPNVPTASNTTKVGYIDYPTSVVEFTIQCTKAGTYVIVIRNANGTDNKEDATHWLTINNGTRIEILIVNSGWDQWGTSIIRANLTQGNNILSLTKGNNFAELDEIDVFLDE